MQFRILYRDEHLVLIDKPAGIAVHRRETESPLARRNCVHILRRQLGQMVYPVHRLDRATSGVLLFALSSEIAGLLQKMFRERAIRKQYFCLCRGWPSEHSFEVDRPLKNDAGILQTASTEFQCVAKAELAFPNGEFPTSRISFLRAMPHTGRYHQIRRHLQGISHPVAGDSRHGDKKWNRNFTAHTKINRMYLLAYSLEFTHPITGKNIFVHVRWPGAWHEAFSWFGYCPLK